MSEGYGAAKSAGGEVPEGFTAIRELGSGPRGRVVLCRRSDGTEVVVRVLPTDGLDAAAVAGLESELAAAAAASAHPCAARTDRVWTDKRLGVCFEQTYCAGGSLASAGSGDPDAVALGGARLAAALAYSHSRGVLHGDVRPANVLLAADGTWLLADGGLAAAAHRARPTVPPADPAYAPREMLGWEKPAPSADVYGLGATLQFALAGAAAVPPVLSGLIERMLAPAPADRPPLTEVDQTLRRLVAAPARNRLPALVLLPLAAAPPRPKLPAALVAEPLATVAANRNRMLIAAGAVGVIFLGGATAVAVSNSGGGGKKSVLTAASAPPVAVSPTPTPTLGKATTDVTPVAKPSKSAAAVPRPAAPASVLAVPPAVAAPQVAAPAARKAPDAKGMVPQRVTVEPSYQQGTIRLTVAWGMDSLPAAITGWLIYLIDRTTGNSVSYNYPDNFGPTLGEFSRTYHVDGVGPSLCAEIQIQTAASAQYPHSERGCPVPALVKAAETARDSARQGAAPSSPKAPAQSPVNSVPNAAPTPKPTAKPAGRP